ncbi:3-oxoacyl-(Acyl-carrier-protein) reductase [Candidatus Moduliflexus flocculans]|uniref:3-oxoacyl-(Acyl-carrier-protein) reductase n=1 Tax=Candidatus Moduliflexus flocculans TaxID=1499966 RepID=A0A0S6VYL4_9BACT|nr:3-oxoacyl-(Acyl-carrier-protein) reductase [Candidatus Moduliflexus flocculans]
MNLHLQGKVAIVTGGGSGLGAGISEVLAEEGAHVVVNYIVDEKNVLQFVDDLQTKYRTHCTALYGDISKAEDIEQVIAQTLAAYGQIDILVNNAGIWPTANIVDMDDAAWRKVIDINLTGTFLFSKRVAQYMLASKIKGRIINTTSKSGFTYSTGGHAHYASAKAGVIMFTKALAREISPYGINVTGIAPGMVRTPMNTKELAVSEAEYVKRIPVGRISEPREVAYTVAFLASDKADFITGTTLDVTGGMLI